MRITLKNIGNIRNADLELKNANVIIGPQSLGKSTILKICSYCSWVEKRIQLTQSPERFEKGKQFISRLIDFHKLDGYFQHDSYIRYESESMTFQYSYEDNTLNFKWKDNRWKFQMSKISYIPSERNMVGAIPNWFDVNLPNNNIRNFMSEWETSRKAIGDLKILNLGLSYHYDKTSNEDQIKLGNNSFLNFTNSSSGLQSIVPMFIVLSNMYEKIENKIGFNDFISDIDNDWQNESDTVKDNAAKIELRNKIYDEVIGRGKQSINEFYKVLYNYLVPQYCKVFLEEPENSLFPPTQDVLINWLLEKTKENPSNFIFVATHSPYVLNDFLEKREDYGMFVVYQDENGFSTVKGLSQEEQGEIYDYGVDSFFNIENVISD